MNEKTVIADHAALKKLFQSEKNPNRPYIYLPLDTDHELGTPEKIAKLIAGYKRSGFGGVIPFYNPEYRITPLTELYYSTYRTILHEADSAGLETAYLDDKYIMAEYLAALDNPASAGCKVLVRYEYACSAGQHFKRTLHETGPLMSLVAVNDDDLTILDIRAFVTDGVLDWTPPEGNWNVEEYVCEYDHTSAYIDLMDYDVSAEYLKRTLGVLLHHLRENENPLSTEQEASPISLFIYRNVLFAGQNRRMWHPDFNRIFEELYGFDPAPYYTLLFRDYPIYEKRYKSMLMTCRSKMLVEGYLKAASDYCRARHIFCTGFPAEGKETVCSWMFGDGQLLHKYASAPGISMPFAYMYGINGIRVASSAADMMGCDTVSADLFNYFLHLTRDVIYREAMSAFVRGVNMTFVHLGEDRTRENTDIVENDASSWGSIFSKGDDLTDFATFVTRVQSLLRGGEHISEAAILYPIHTLHASVYLYHSDFTGFEYPSTPENADYMELMNSFLSYVGVDTVFLHPDFLSERAFCENGVLYLGGDHSMMKFKLLILPSMSIISLKMLRVIKKFFMEGGKIIATDHLPEASCECSTIFDNINTALKTETAEDKEVREIVEFIFGKDVMDNRIFRSYYKNENENGGVAYFFPSNKSSADGTESVSANILHQAVTKFAIAPDVYIDRMPRREFFGILNFHLPDFLKIGVDKRLAKGCSMNYLHKRYAGCDVYYFTNASGDTYTGSILLRGVHNPEEWNPYTGKMRKLTTALVRFRDEIYTKIILTLDASSSVFVVSPMPRSNKDALRDIPDQNLIPVFYPHENI